MPMQRRRYATLQAVYATRAKLLQRACHPLLCLPLSRLLRSDPTLELGLRENYHPQLAQCATKALKLLKKPCPGHSLLPER